MYDRFNRHISYLRISVTDRCNFRCVYCMPAEGIPHKKHEDILSFKEIYDIVKQGAELGIKKLRIT
ncbi:MAG TPA: radical SAM protein, partial [Draconibacterium sp.]|nr:radical SAM protein [Draconibacterium sp.]